MTWTKFLAPLAVVLATACAPAELCTPGELRSCDCASGTRSLQRCNTTGGFGACMGCPTRPGCTSSCVGRVCGDDGCGNSCGSCGLAQQCSSSGSCDYIPAASWSFIVTNGRISERTTAGDTWDALGGLPDGRICVTLNGAMACTSEASDTLSPVWNTRLGSVTTNALRNGIPFVFSDMDGVSDDAICSGSFVATDAMLSARGAMVTCGASSFNISIVPE